jgi:hypothetical protein
MVAAMERKWYPRGRIALTGLLVFNVAHGNRVQFRN